MRLFPLIFAACLAMTPAQALDSSAGKLTVTKMVDRLNDPWALGFLPDGGLVITEKAGRVLHIENDQRRELGGLPDVATRGQGGEHDCRRRNCKSQNSHDARLIVIPVPCLPQSPFASSNIVQERIVEQGIVQ